MVDVYVRGADYLVIDQGGTLEGAQPFEASPLGRPADLGALGMGEVIPSLRATDARVTAKGKYVRVAGTLHPDDLVALAKQLRLTTDNNAKLVYID